MQTPGPSPEEGQTRSKPPDSLVYYSVSRQDALSMPSAPYFLFLTPLFYLALPLCLRNSTSNLFSQIICHFLPILDECDPILVPEGNSTWNVNYGLL